MKSLSLFLGLASVAFAQSANNPTAEERFARPPDELVQRESAYYRRISLPIPEGLVLEVGGLLALPDRSLLVTTRRGEIWRVEGAYENDPKPTYTLFAQGLHEILGIVAAPGGGYYVAQRPEITRIKDEDGDGRADRFDTVAVLPIYGNYHEYAFGPVLTPEGNLRVTLNVAFGAPTQSPVPWRGWIMEITPDGRMTPVAAGLRSPAGFTRSSRGDWFFTDNQGEWVGSGRVAHIEPGDFFGHPASLAWTDLAGANVPMRLADIRDFGEPMHEVAKRLPAVKPPAVWLPHTILGISNSDITEDLTSGRFGPFAGQFLIGDQGQSKILRMSLEQVKGVYQGAAYSFRSGFESGVMRFAWGVDGSLFVGGTNRGWGSVGPKDFSLERLVWTGQTPFEIKEVRAQPDGFVVSFTHPVDPTTAGDPRSYRTTRFTYLYHEAYGSRAVEQESCPVALAQVAEDGLSVRLAVAGMKEGFVHELRAAGVRRRGANGEPLVHDTAYYTLNVRPDGDRIISEQALADLCGPSAVAANTSAGASFPKRTAEPPAAWQGQVDVTLTLNTVSGLKFDQERLTVKRGSRVKLVLNNPDDMLHNWVLVRPGRGTDVGNAALNLGIDGMPRQFVPESDDVIAHTLLLEPQKSDTIYFTAPDQPGEYEYLCTFPGHATLMRGVLRVE